MNLLRAFFVIYFIFLFFLLGANNYSLGDLDSFLFFYFIQLVILFEVANFVLKGFKIKVNIKTAYFMLFVYVVINSLILAFYPQLRNLVFNRLGHIISGVIYAIISVELMSATLVKTKSNPSKPFFLLFAFSLASTAGVFNEIIELGLDIFTGSHRIGVGFDTAIDLLMNTLGILTVLIFKKVPSR